MKHFYVIAFLNIVFLTSSCTKVLEGFKIDYEGDKLVILGRINNLDGIYVYLTHTFSPAEIYYFDSIDIQVENATIVLFENNTPKDTLDELSGGIYTSPFLPTPHFEYHLEITHPNYSHTTTQKVKMPDTIPSIEIQAETGFTDINGDPALHFTPAFTDIQNQTQTYVFALTFFLPDATIVDNAGFEIPDNEGFNCGPFKMFYNNKNYHVFTDQCFDGASFPYYFEFPVVYYNETGVISFVLLNYYYGTVSEELSSFLVNKNDELSFEQIFVEPKISYTNVQEGYGVFWAENILQASTYL